MTLAEGLHVLRDTDRYIENKDMKEMRENKKGNIIMVCNVPHP